MVSAIVGLRQGRLIRYGIMDPAAGQWFPDMALELVHNANPPLP
jgi:hypothetical protein